MAFGRMLESTGGGAQGALLLEGEELRVALDLDAGWIELCAGAATARCRLPDASGPWYPYASSGGACTVVLRPA